MRKRKNGERRWRRRIKRLVLFVLLGIVFVLSLPTMYAFVTYYHVPETETENRGWITDSTEPYKLCVTT